MICDLCDCDFMESQVKAECMLKCFAKSTGATVLVSLYFSYIRSFGISNNLTLTFFFVLSPLLYGKMFVSLHLEKE